MSSSRLIWLTETPNIAGSISLRMRPTPGWRVSRRGRGSIRMRARNGTWNSSWISPAMNTAQASANTGSANQREATSAPAISVRFRNSGVIAGTAKRA